MAGTRGRDHWIASTLTGFLVISMLFTLIGAKSASEGRNMIIRLNGYIPTLVRQSAVLGKRAVEDNLRLAIALQPRNEQLMMNLEGQQAQSPRDHTRVYLTPDEIAAHFAPRPAQEAAVINFMQQAGFRLASSNGPALLLSFQGTVGDAEQAFHITILNYRTTDRRVFFAPEEEPVLPAGIASLIGTIIGLDSTLQFAHRPMEVKAQSQVRHGSIGCPGEGKGYYLPAQLARAYGLDSLAQTGLQGQGQTIALVEMNDFANADIKAYRHCFGGEKISLQRIPVDGGAGSPAGPGAAEVELDIETIMSAAPDLQALKVYEAPNDDADYLTELAQIVNDDIPVISTSWGDCEESEDAHETYQVESRIFAIAALQGETIFAASGDNGNSACGSLSPASASVEDPASQPEVTSVGGTSLQLTSSETYLSEQTWKEPELQEASGGGVSSLWKMPAWQSGPGVIEKGLSSGKPCHAPSGTYCREVPDVSMDADPQAGYLVYCTLNGTGICNPQVPWLVLGGTSAGAPMWAVLAALANQKAHQDGYQKNLGFLNPALYKIGQSADGTLYEENFHDTVSGDNAIVAGKITGYPAGPGYDMATGWGSYRGLALVTTLERLIFGGPPAFPSGNEGKTGAATYDLTSEAGTHAWR